jgi:ribonuclease PH
MRNDGRADDQLRPIKITRNFTSTPAGSVLWEQGKTIVLVTASVTQELPPFFKETRAGVDMNVALTAGGKFVEVQGGAENGEGFDRGTMNRLLDLAERGCRDLMRQQSAALAP